MKVFRLVPLVAGLAAGIVTVLYVAIMVRQGHSPDPVSVAIITATFASSSAAFFASATVPPSPSRIILLTWGSTVALFWTVLLNTLTPLWLPIAVLGWIATVRATRAYARDNEGENAWPLVGGTWAIGVALLGIAVFGSVAVGRSPESGSGQGIATPR